MVSHTAEEEHGRAGAKRHPRHDGGANCTGDDPGTLSLALKRALVGLLRPHGPGPPSSQYSKDG